jgi:hypothetical protein
MASPLLWLPTPDLLLLLLPRLLMGPQRHIHPQKVLCDSDLARAGRQPHRGTRLLRQVCLRSMSRGLSVAAMMPVGRAMHGCTHASAAHPSTPPSGRQWRQRTCVLLLSSASAAELRALPVVL